MREFSAWLDTLPHKHKVVIAGNHELTFDDDFCSRMAKAAEESEDKGAGDGSEDLATGALPRMSPLRSISIGSGRGPGGSDVPGALAVSR